MPYAQPEIKAFKGLYLQQNSFAVPDGALEICDNCVITQDGVISKRRGNSVFAAGGGNTLNNLFNFQGFLLALYNNQITWLDSSGAQTALSTYTGITIAETNRTGRSVESNSNLYFTSDNGPLKLETYSGTVFKAGTPPALDLRAKFIDGMNGPIGDGSTLGTTIGSTQVGWRATFGKIDGNGNFLESAPSDMAVLTLSPKTQQAATWNGTTVTVTSPNHGFVSLMTVNIRNAFTPNAAGTAVPGIQGSYPITVVDANTFTYANSTTPGASGVLDVATSYTARLEFSVPSEIQDTSYFWRLYRSSQSNANTTSPTLDFKLIKQANLTAGQIANGVVFFTDNILDIFQSAAQELYTNPNSQEGELQANARPPLVQDVAFYKNHVFYANAVTRHLLELALVSSDPTFVNSGDFIEVKQGGTTRRYIFRASVGNSTVSATANGATTIIGVTYTAHGMSNGDTVYVSNVTGTVPEGRYTITVTGANTFQFTSTGNSATALDFQGFQDNADHGLVQLVPGGAAGLDATARAIVKAINRDTSSPVYARYVSTPQAVPGLMEFEAKQFGGAFSFRANTDQVGQAFSPVLPSSFVAGTQVTSTSDVLPNAIFSSKVGEPEAVPIANEYPIGSKNKAILRVVALRDCCIIIKEDGIFRLDGDTTGNFVSTILDSTVFCLVPNSVALIDNTVMMLSNQGVVKVSSSAVQIVSYNIEQVIRPILGAATLVASTSAVTYESERFYLLSTLLPNTTTPSIVYCYNVLSSAWTTWDTVFVNGTIGPVDKLFLITTDNKIKKERKLQNKLDYCAENYAVTIVSVAPDGLSAVINTPGIGPQALDIIVSANVISRIKSVTPAAPNNTVTFYRPTNLVAAGSAVYYAAFTSTIKFAPFHGGQVNRMKQFAQFQVHFRDTGATYLTLNFSGDTFGGSETLTWDASSTNLTSGSGWGFEPWGLFPWGEDQGINLTYNTQPSPILRTYVPRFAQRSTFIQPQIVHAVAGERIGIQEIGYSVRGYGERVSK